MSNLCDWCGEFPKVRGGSCEHCKAEPDWTKFAPEDEVEEEESLPTVRAVDEHGVMKDDHVLAEEIFEALSKTGYINETDFDDNSSAVLETAIANIKFAAQRAGQQALDDQLVAAIVWHPRGKELMERITARRKEWWLEKAKLEEGHEVGAGGVVTIDLPNKPASPNYDDGWRDGYARGVEAQQTIEKDWNGAPGASGGGIWVSRQEYLEGWRVKEVSPGFFAKVMRCDYGDDCPGHQDPKEPPCDHERSEQASRARRLLPVEQLAADLRAEIGGTLGPATGDIDRMIDALVQASAPRQLTFTDAEIRQLLHQYDPSCMPQEFQEPHVEEMRKALDNLFARRRG